TPGHTVGHQSVVVDGDGEEVLIGDAAYTPQIYGDPDQAQLPDGQAADREAWPSPPPPSAGAPPPGPAPRGAGPPPGGRGPPRPPAPRGRAPATSISVTTPTSFIP